MNVVPSRSMSFLEAHKIATSFAGGPPLSFLLAMSGTPDKLGVFLRASAAQHGRSLEIRTLPFNTLSQALLSDVANGETEVFVLFPWDFVAESDWRSGFSVTPLDEDTLRERSQSVADRIAHRTTARVVYIAAPMPPIFADQQRTRRLHTWLIALAGTLKAHILGPETFSLGSYLSSGSPFSSAHLGSIAESIVDAAMREMTAEPKKLLITDLDNVMWHGIIGEDGLDGIHYGPEGVGFRHFVYQTFLAKTKREGTLLAAVSRNDSELANEPFRSGRMTLGPDDFVAIVASYHAKSAQIKQIADQLNLGLDSFVFVDDNPIEIEEVSAALPGITAVHFPANDDGLPAFFDRMSALFTRAAVTSEDAERTAMYRRRLEGMVPTSAEGADLTAFLRDLQMSLDIHDRSSGDRLRAVQLINKTNQFNLNGRRVTDEEVGSMMQAGGKLYTASLTDRTGSHGEIFAVLIDASGTVQSLVMSCRVFQRRVEFAFFTWLASQHGAPRTLYFVETARNEPIRQFLQDPAFSATSAGDEIVTVDIQAFAHNHADDLTLFAMQGLHQGQS